MSDRPIVARGFVCPRCNARLYVHGIRHAARGITTRYRVCRACNYRVVTEERPRTSGAAAGNGGGAPGPSLLT